MLSFKLLSSILRAKKISEDSGRFAWPGEQRAAGTEHPSRLSLAM